jgi:hypothetical protein
MRQTDRLGGIESFEQTLAEALMETPAFVEGNDGTHFRLSRLRHQGHCGASRRVKIGSSVFLLDAMDERAAQARHSELDSCDAL